MAVHSFTLVPAAYVFLLRETGSDTEVLLQLRRNTGYMDGHWACGSAGHVEANESVVDTAIRETHEELGLTLSPADLVPLTGMHRTNGGTEPLEQRVDWFFSCRTRTGEPRVMEPEKDGGLRWFRLADLPDTTVPHERAVLDALTAGDVPAIMTFGFGLGEDSERYHVALPH